MEFHMVPDSSVIDEVEAASRDRYKRFATGEWLSAASLRRLKRRSHRHEPHRRHIEYRPSGEDERARFTLTPKATGAACH